MPPQCQYFLLCDRPAVGTIDNPFLGPVPSCERCATRMEQKLTRYPDPHLVKKD